MADIGRQNQNIGADLDRYGEAIANQKSTDNSPPVEGALVMCTNATNHNIPVKLVKDDYIQVTLSGLAELSSKDITLGKPFSGCREAQDKICRVQEETAIKRRWHGLDYSKSEGEGREGLLSEDSYMICMEQYGIISIVNSGQQIFTRALSQMGGYNHKEVDLKITQVETYAWVNGAGKVYKYNSRESDRRKFEERYFCEELGLDKEDYLYFRQMIRLQHFITSNEEDKYSYSTVVNMVNDDDKKNIHGWMDTMTEATEKNTMRNIMAIGYIITKNIWMTINRYMTGPLIKEIFHI